MTGDADGVLDGMKTKVEELEADSDDAVVGQKTLVEQIHEAFRRENAYESAAGESAQLRERVIDLGAELQ